MFWRLKEFRRTETRYDKADMMFSMYYIIYRDLDAIAICFLLKSSWFNTPQLAAENWGCGGFVPPHTQIFQGEILNTSELAPGILYFGTG
jgi:hypothetical protein